MNTKKKKQYEKLLCRVISVRPARLLYVSNTETLPYDPNNSTYESL